MSLLTPVVIYLISCHGKPYVKTCRSLLDLSKKQDRTPD